MKYLIILLTFCTACVHYQRPVDETWIDEPIPVGEYAAQETENGNCIWIEPYVRKDGTCVRGHWRSAEDCNCSLVGKVYLDCPTATAVGLDTPDFSPRWNIGNEFVQNMMVYFSSLDSMAYYYRTDTDEIWLIANEDLPRLLVNIQKVEGYDCLFNIKTDFFKN